MLKRYLEVGFDVMLAYAAYHFFGWIGFAMWVVFMFGWFATQLIANQQVTANTLLSRLPDRCSLCHREIVDEGGVFDEDGIYHEMCSDKLEALEGLRQEAEVPFTEAIHRPWKRTTRHA
jgi:hypothetical protein